jgi:hypothetical protein
MKMLRKIPLSLGETARNSLNTVYLGSKNFIIKKDCFYWGISGYSTKFTVKLLHKMSTQRVKSEDLNI